MSSTPLFSCVIPVKGERPFLGEALASLAAQGLGEDLEIIVQDGGAEGAGAEDPGAGASGRVKWFREPDAGQSDALNKGFARARGEWLFWLNADDVLLPGALGRVGEFVGARPAAPNWIAGDTVYIDTRGKVTEVRTDAKWRSWFGRRLSVWTGGPSAFFRRGLWGRRGGFDTDLKYAMDIDLWTRWAKAGERFAGLGAYVWGFRMHDASKTGSGRFAAEQAEELAAIDARYGVSTGGFWRNLTRAASVLDGGWIRRRCDNRRLVGRPWNALFA